MSVVINFNAAAMSAANNLATSNEMLQRSLDRLSSGSKIVNPSDDAGGLAVSMKLEAADKRSGAASSNIGNAVSYLQTQDGVLKVAGNILNRMSELATLYTDGTKSTSDKANYSAEFSQLQTELTNLSSEKFNNVSLFGNSGFSVNTNEDGTGAVSFSSIDLSTQTNGLSIGTLSGITTAIQSLATDRAQNGAYQSVLGFASSVLSVNQQNLEAADSRITNVDVAAESTQLARYQVLTQSGTAMLAQANQSAQSVLRLLQ